MSEWPIGDGEMAELIRSFDWGSTPLGPIARWPQSLRTIVDLMLASRSMMSLVWGPEAIHLYNDSFTELLREHRIPALGRSAYETFARSRDVFEADIAAGRSARFLAQRYPVLRQGHMEDAWFDVDYTPIRDEAGAVAGVLWTLKETTAQHLAEQALRASETRHRLSKARLQAAIDLVGLSSYNWDPASGALQWDARLRAMWGLPPDAHVDQDVWLSGIHPDDRPRVEDAVTRCTDPAGDGVYHIEYRVIGLQDRIERWVSTYGRTTFEDGRPVGFTGAALEITERKRAEAALRESEERFRQFAASSSDALWIRSAETLEMEYASPAVETIYGVPPGTILGDPKHWAALIVPEDRDGALRRLEQARRGEAVVHEFRILRSSDGTFRWIKSTDFPLHDDGRIPRIGGIAEDVTEAKLAAGHSAVLLAELQHRVRNIMAIIRSITARTGESAASVAEYAALMAGRLLTLGRVQALLTRAANAGVGITGIVRDELDAQAHHEGQYTIEGRDLVLSPKAAEILTLAVHELTTNALKYGALSAPHGHVTVRWATFEKCGASWLGFDWTEEGAPERPQLDLSVPRRRGFGSELIEARIPYELGGRGKVVIEPGGAHCHLEFPLRDGDSILKTDAPQRATVFGGALDMTGEPDLSGHHVLIVENDYYLATDTARALREAGAEVLGPCPIETAARDELAEQRPDAAVVDINLGSGQLFKLAETLKDQGIPFVFITGYDSETIPVEFEGVERLQKPVQLRQIVAAVSKLVSKAG